MAAKQIQRILFLFLLECFSVVWAAEDGSRCAIVLSTQDILNCAITRHPSVGVERLGVEQAGELEKQAAQRPNPELGVNSVWGTQWDGKSSESSVGLSHVFELAGKRRARIDKSQEIKKFSEAELYQRQEQIALEMVESLYRLRQLYQEQLVILESIETFDKILAGLRRLPRLTPEQQVSLNVFRLIKGDYTLQNSQLLQKEVELKNFFAVATGLSFEVIKQFLPPPTKDWSSLKAKAFVHFGDAREALPLNNGAVRLARAELGMANRDVGLAESQTWGELRVGPLLQVKNDPQNSLRFLGVGLSLPLPLYQRNEGGKSVARKSEAKADAQLQYLLFVNQRERAIKREILEEVTKTFDATPSLEELEKHHHQLESLFYRGLVPSTLVIEAHRQILEYTRSKNERELQAMMLIWKIYALEGRILTERL